MVHPRPRLHTVSVTDLPEEAAALFREDPERFVTARDALVADLRSKDRPQEAAAVKGLRRPTAVVWALNQLSRDPSAVRELLDAGAELRAAQQATLSSTGTGADRLRAATSAQRTSVSRLTQVAGDLLEAAGRGVKADEITSALEAASVNEEIGLGLSTGRLERPPSPVSGFGDVFGLTAVAGGRTEDRAGDAVPDRAAARPRASSGSTDAELDEADSEVARLRRDRDAATRRAQTAGATAERLEVRADGMRERLAAAEAEHAEADARARGADLEVARAERELAKATERLERLRR